MLKEGGSYKIYASWFEKQLENYPKRLYTLGKNNHLFNSLDSVIPFMGPARKTDFKTLTLKDNHSENAVAILEHALLDPSCSVMAAKLNEELGILLFPGTVNPSPKDLIAAIRQLVNRREPDG